MNKRNRQIYIAQTYMDSANIPDQVRELWYSKYQFVDTTTMQNGTPTIEINGPMLSELESDAKFRDAIITLGPKTDFRLNINSPGGEVAQASAIRTRMDEHEGKITAHVMGLAASAAHYITLSADVIRMSPDSKMMIHLPHGLNMTYGTADEQERASARLVADLRKTERRVIDDLGARLNISEDKIMQLLKDETYLNAEEAVELGLADEIYPKRKAKSKTGAGESVDLSASLRELRALSARLMRNP